MGGDENILYGAQLCVLSPDKGISKKKKKVLVWDYFQARLKKKWNLIPHPPELLVQLYCTSTEYRTRLVWGLVALPGNRFPTGAPVTFLNYFCRFEFRRVNIV